MQQTRRRFIHNLAAAGAASAVGLMGCKDGEKNTPPEKHVIEEKVATAEEVELAYLAINDRSFVFAYDKREKMATTLSRVLGRKIDAGRDEFNLTKDDKRKLLAFFVKNADGGRLKDQLKDKETFGRFVHALGLNFVGGYDGAQALQVVESRWDEKSIDEFERTLDRWIGENGKSGTVGTLGNGFTVSSAGDSRVVTASDNAVYVTLTPKGYRVGADYNASLPARLDSGIALQTLGKDEVGDFWDNALNSIAKRTGNKGFLDMFGSAISKVEERDNLLYPAVELAADSVALVKYRTEMKKHLSERLDSQGFGLIGLKYSEAIVNVTENLSLAALFKKLGDYDKEKRARNNAQVQYEGLVKFSGATTQKEKIVRWEEFSKSTSALFDAVVEGMSREDVRNNVLKDFQDRPDAKPTEVTLRYEGISKNQVQNLKELRTVADDAYTEIYTLR